MENTSFEVLPFRVSLLITQRLHQLRMVTDEHNLPNIPKLFFGRFRNDRTGKIFCIFCSIYVEQSQMMKFYDPNVLQRLPVKQLFSVEFNYVYYSYCSNDFLENAKRLISFERVMIHEDTTHLIPKVSSLKKFVFGVHELTDDIVKDIMKLKKMRYLGYKLITHNTPKKDTVLSTDLELEKLRKLLLNNYVPKSFTFSKLPSLKLLHIWYSKVSSLQLLNIAQHKNLTELQLIRCTLEGHPISVFQNTSIRKLSLCFCSLTINEDTVETFSIDEKKSQLVAAEISGFENICPDFWKHFVKLGRLRKLLLGQTDLDSSFLLDLVEKKKENNWKKGFYLQISSTSEITKESEEMFINEFPDVELKLFRRKK